MKPGDRVSWTSRFGAKLEGTALEFNQRRPLRKRGVSLGSWTDRFYRPMVLVSFVHPSGKPGVQWMNATTVNKDMRRRNGKA